MSAGVSKKIAMMLVGLWAMQGIAVGQIQITEFAYDAVNGEFVELTNRGAAPVDMTGWTLDDDGVTAGVIALDGFGIVAPGETVIVAQSADAATFRAAGGLAPTVKVVTYVGGQYQRNDIIRVFDAGAMLATQLAYGDQNFPGTIRTQNRGGWPCAEALGQSPITVLWNLASVGDAQMSFTSTGADIGSPGFYTHTFCGPPPVGACCNSGTCTDGQTDDDCQMSGGTYQGDNSLCANLVCPAPSGGIIRITEYMYSGSGGEFIEFTNLDANPIDMTGWSYDDDSSVAGTVDLSAFGIINPGESVILAEDDAATFVTDWNLSGVTVIGNLTTNLGRNDQINLFDAGAVLADRLSFGDQTFPGTIRTQNVSGFPCDDAVGQNDIFQWFLSSPADAQNSYASSNGDVGNPGSYVNVDCPTCGNGVVEIGEDCDGGVCCTPNCTYVTAGTECRIAAGPCDAAEACTGSSADCPADGLQSAGFECRASAGDCDVAELCDGVTVDCPMDGFQPISLECRASAGVCDPAEFCTGGSADCPADAFEPSSTECRAPAGDCDVAEFCNGEGADCPADEFAPNTVECRPAVDACDLAETCTGADVNCPGNTFAASGTQCADDGDACTNDACDGNGVCNHPESGECGACCTAGNVCQNRVLPAACTGQGGVSFGAGSACLGDADGDGVDDLCDECPGVDDAVFAPGCAGAIPTVSQWGLVILALSLLALSKALGLEARVRTA